MFSPSFNEPTGLYPRLLGAAWKDVAVGVRGGHLPNSSGAMQGAGVFQIRHGAGRWLRRMARWIGLPREADAAPTRVVVVATERGEVWRRTFGDRELVTHQAARPGAILAERFRGLELHFDLKVEDGALIFRQRRAYVRLGPLALPLPRWSAPQTAAREETAGPDRTRVRVEVSFPGIGLIVSYGGEVQWQPTD